MRNHIFGVMAIAAVLVCCLSEVSAQQPQQLALNPLPSLEAVQWAGRPASLDALKGKTVVALVYAMWCPKCNVWSGEFFTQLKEAVKDKPIVVLAINADDSPAGVQQYLSERGFFAPNILHGYDPSMPKRLGFESNLYNFALIGPDGKPFAKGPGGAFFKTPQGKKFALAMVLTEKDHGGKFDFITPEMSDEVKTLFWPWELGTVSEAAVKAAGKKLGPEQKKQIDAAIDRYLNGKLEQVRKQYNGTVPEKIEAYQIATTLSGMFKTTTQSKKAKEVVTYLNTDKSLKRELAAKKAYDGALQRASADPKRAATLLRAIAKRFEGTHYGKLAEEAKAGGD